MLRTAINMVTANYAGLDEPFMKALVETDGLMAVFSGHDHGIEYVLIFKTKKKPADVFQLVRKMVPGSVQ